MQKNIFRLKSLALPGLALMLIAASCNKADHYYKDYVKKQEYIGRIDSVNIIPGKNRVKVSWNNPADPKVSSQAIYWNNKKDSVIRTLNRNLGSEFVIIDNLSEGDYNFTFITRGQTGIIPSRPN